MFVRMYRNNGFFTSDEVTALSNVCQYVSVESLIDGLPFPALWSGLIFFYLKSNSSHKVLILVSIKIIFLLSRAVRRQRG